MKTATKLESLRNRSVGIAGCGGLGSNCAVALARAGVGKFVLADFDIVTLSNLNRQYFFLDQVGLKKVDALKVNLLRINPLLIIECHDMKLDPDMIVQLYSQCDVIVEAFDLAEGKQMLIETVLSKMPEKYLVSGIGLAGWGGNEQIREHRFGNLIVCGDLEHEVSEEMPPLAPRVGVVANMEANAVLEILLEILPA